MPAEPTATREQNASWTPMVGLFLAQVLMSFNVAALPVSLGGIVADFDVAPTVASTTENAGEAATTVALCGCVPGPAAAGEGDKWFAQALDWEFDCSPCLPLRRSSLPVRVARERHGSPTSSANIR